jgi:hypothetical protein
MFSDTVVANIKKLDVYRKLPSDLTEPTAAGAIVSMVASIVMALLFISELSTYLSVGTTSEMFVDLNRGGERLNINFDVALPRFPCSGLSLDVQDVMGTHITNISGSINKTRTSSAGDALPEDESPTTVALFKK